MREAIMKSVHILLALCIYFNIAADQHAFFLSAVDDVAHYTEILQVQLSQLQGQLDELNQMSSCDCLDEHVYVSYNVFESKLNALDDVVQEFHQEFHAAIETVSISTLDKVLEYITTYTFAGTDQSSQQHITNVVQEVLEINRIKLSSSKNVVIMKVDDVWYASHSPDHIEPFFQLRESDHNLWYGDNEDLWGYDKFGKLFVIDKNNKRRIVTG
ncbi:MAG: hypothetical protein WD055_04295 [Candidatus Dependentiae bacterium]